jgi:ArsR family transcriptional regulator
MLQKAKEDICMHDAEHIRTGTKGMPKDEQLSDLADLFKMFADSTRVKIMFALMENELCVRDISSALNMTQSAISHQLKILKSANLVSNRREGKTIWYRLSDDHVKSIIAQGFDHILE